jgi:hypothetical protein
MDFQNNIIEATIGKNKILQFTDGTKADISEFETNSH